MAQGLFLLHSEHVTASRDLLALWDAQTPSPGEVVTSHEAAVALMPAFQGYPAVVYEDATGARSTLFNPPDLAAVTAWRNSIDNPSPVTILTHLAFRKRFTFTERTAIEAAAVADPEVRTVQKDFEAAQEIDLTYPDLIAGLTLLMAKGLLTQTRVNEILGVTS